MALMMQTMWSWLWPWEPSLLVALALAAMGTWAWRARRRLGAAQRGLLAAGVALAYIVLHTRFDYYSEHEFFIHRLQHLVLHHLAPFLIALAWPESTLARWPHCLSRLGRIGRPLRAACAPWLTALLFNGLVLLWLIPVVHFPAMLDWRLYRVMNWSMLVNGLLFWTLALRGAAPDHPRLSATRQITMMLAVTPGQIALGALIFFAPQELYPLYTLCGRAVHGIDAMADQQIGGLILSIPGAMMSVAGILLVFSRRLRGTRHAAHGTDLCDAIATASPHEQPPFAG